MGCASRCNRCHKATTRSETVYLHNDGQAGGSCEQTPSQILVYGKALSTSSITIRAMHRFLARCPSSDFGLVLDGRPLVVPPPLLQSSYPLCWQKSCTSTNLQFVSYRKIFAAILGLQWIQKQVKVRLKLANLLVAAHFDSSISARTAYLSFPIVYTVKGKGFSVSELVPNVLVPKQRLPIPETGPRVVVREGARAAEGGDWVREGPGWASAW